jgi:ABC-type methionine transport system permease subunit
MRGNIGKAFLLAMVVSLITIVFSWILGIVVASVPWPHEMAKPVVVNMLQVLIVPLQSAPFLLLYYDLRIRKEAFDLEQLASLQTGGVETQ